jgi:hypothetical protein
MKLTIGEEDMVEIFNEVCEYVLPFMLIFVWPAGSIIAGFHLWTLGDGALTRYHLVRLVSGWALVLLLAQAMHHRERLFGIPGSGLYEPLIGGIAGSTIVTVFMTAAFLWMMIGLSIDLHRPHLHSTLH